MWDWFQRRNPATGTYQKKAREIVTTQGIPNVMRSAYRESDGEDYVILWPSSLTEFSVL